MTGEVLDIFSADFLLEDLGVLLPLFLIGYDLPPSDFYPDLPD